ncbi:MAG: aminotransferase class III-fold pyridoxal phosphate-dependent enzyme, partial [Halobacteriovoraceae bacterium]|nr:aminotransferase class III-fold pyridoxal phosphate-dependent enzyme [Halobacteriovoraceae bacterium]
MEITLINENDQKYAQQRLDQYYQNGMIPAEKKAYLTELSNNAGPFMGIETDNGETHYLLDAASQIATLGLGFSPSVFMGTTHFLSSWTNNSKTKSFLKLKNAFHSFLMRETGWSHLDMTICNSGAESNEIALGYSYKRRKNQKAKKVLAFEGSFHGRMLISLYSTWNKTKREPFTWSGYETEFTDFPELPGAEINQDYPEKWRETWDTAPSKGFETPKEWEKDETLEKEVKSLLNIKTQLDSGEIFALIVEPMQCEGGDRYASDRFFTALLLMARSYGVDVIFDEVQTGFHLGRSFFWHRQFCLRDQNDNQLNPDYLICAKKAQVGLVLSPHDLKRQDIEAKEQYQAASVARGYIHALALQQSKETIHNLQDSITKRLKKYALEFKGQVSRPRALGMSFAFDLTDNQNIAKFIEKRFNHGLLYYPAGSNTLRFRLNTSYSEKDLDFLFERLKEISNEVFNQKNSNFNGKADSSI